MTRFAILLDSGAIFPVYGVQSHKDALAALHEWHNRRRRIANDPRSQGRRFAVPRRAIGLVTYRKEPR